MMIPQSDFHTKGPYDEVAWVVLLAAGPMSLACGPFRSASSSELLQNIVQLRKINS